MARPDIAAIRERAEAATPGPWTIPDGDLNGRIWAIGPIAGYDYDALELFEDDPNAIFVSHAREDIPALLVYVAELERYIDERLAAVPPIPGLFRKETIDATYGPPPHGRYARKSIVGIVGIDAEGRFITRLEQPPPPESEQP